MRKNILIPTLFIVLFATFLNHSGSAQITTIDFNDLSYRLDITRFCFRGGTIQWDLKPNTNGRIGEFVFISCYSKPPRTVLSREQNNVLRIHSKDHSRFYITIIYTEEGFLEGHRLAAFRMKAGDRLTSVTV